MGAAKDVAQAVATALSGAPHSLAYGTTVRDGPPQSSSESAVTRAIPTRCVFCLGVGGQPDIAYKDGGAGTEEFFPTVQITVRSAARDFDAGLTLAEAVFNAIDKAPPTGYRDARARGSQPWYVGKDEEGHHLWTINVELEKETG